MECTQLIARAARKAAILSHLQARCYHARPPRVISADITGLMSSIRERNKELILRAASEEFADKGFAASKTSDIAAKAGVPKPNVYYYFKSKENLYREVLESTSNPILRASTPFNADGEPNTVLSNYIRSKIVISRDLPFAPRKCVRQRNHAWRPALE